MPLKIAPLRRHVPVSMTLLYPLLLIYSKTMSKSAHSRLSSQKKLSSILAAINDATNVIYEKKLLKKPL